MRFTTSALRSLLTNQAAFVASARTATAATTQYGNPQRKWLEAAIREYYRRSKDVNALWKTFDGKVQQRPSTPSRQANAAGAVRLLERFLEWDAADPEMPADAFPPIRDVAIGGHVIAIRRDLIYIDGNGYRVRQLWTDHQLHPQNPAAVQMAAAVMLSVDADLGVDSTTGVEIWGLRHGAQQSWTRQQLRREIMNLTSRLDIVEQQIQQP
jgi:hypothetical protein